MDLSNKRVVVIGGGSGMGLAVARVAAGRGATVLIAGRDEEKLRRAKEQLGEAVTTAPLDVTDEAAVGRFFAAGPLDHLVVTATASEPGPLLEADTAAVRAAFETKFWGQFFAAKYAAPHVRAGGSITLFSGVASRKPPPGNTVVGPQNGAVEALGRSLAVDLAPLRVNVVAPGLIDTPYWTDDGQRRAVFAAAEKLPVRRVGTPDDVAAAVLFLMTNGFVTGGVVDVEGGGLLV